MDRIEEIFVRLLEKSPGIALTVFVILLIRFLLRNYPKKYTGLLWTGLGIRLLWVNPVLWRGIAAVENPVSRVFGRSAVISRDSTGGLIRNIGGTGGFHVWAIASEDGFLSPNPVNKGQLLVSAGALIWITGLLVFLGYFLVSYLRMRKRVRFAVRLRDNIYECGEIDCPFILGVAKPVIYLPFHMEEAQQRAVICHESCHIRRKDYLVKMLAFLLLGIYWFHPLVWMSYVLMCRDMEMSCDEMAVEQSGICTKQSYSAALLAFAAERSLMGNMLGFGEHNTSKRIRNILKFRAPGKGKRVLLTLLCGVLVPVLGCEVTLAKEEKITASETAWELYRASAPYVGDASAVNGLLFVLEKNGILPAGERTLELLTEEEPYGLRLNFAEAPENEEQFCEQMYDAGILLWALVGNLENVEWSFPPENKPEEGILKTYCLGKEELPDANRAMSEIKDIKEYGKSEAKVEELLGLLELEPETEPAYAPTEELDVSVSVIGGADGPTSVFLAGKIEKAELEDAIGGYLLKEQTALLKDKNGFPVVSFKELKPDPAPNSENGVYTAYLWTMCKSYEYSAAEGMTEKETLYRPARMELNMDENGEYQLLSCWFSEEEDPEKAEAFLRENFPSDLWDAALDGEPYRAELEAECENQVQELEEMLKTVVGSSKSYDK